MVARLLGAELSSENPGIEERRETHDNRALALGILSLAHLRICSRKKRTRQHLYAAPGAPCEGAVSGLDGLVVAVEEVKRKA